MARMASVVGRPPIVTHAAPATEASASPFTSERPLMRVWPVPIPDPGVAPDDTTLRRFWVAALGAGAVEDLLRLMIAADRRETIRLPRFLPELMASGVASINRDVIWVPARLPLLPRYLAKTLPHCLRREYREWRAEVRSGSG